ncbi:hypothetical protein SeMB42_g06289 [Synchytrium endobioticum]|uniref:Uncharacterized protein n=1 Tax=Synchytrium endobioticum TaxID=286115 RepID=A0A507CMB9_9FUNG|nr:hypothetical protein SeMB42_g06289 [Synchytrium endobioticum]
MITARDVDPVTELIDACTSGSKRLVLVHNITSFIKQCQLGAIDYRARAPDILDALHHVASRNDRDHEITTLLIQCWMLYCRCREHGLRLLVHHRALTIAATEPRDTQDTTHFIDIMSTWMARQPGRPLDTMFDVSKAFALMDTITHDGGRFHVSALASLCKCRALADSLRGSVTHAFIRSLIARLAEDTIMSINALRILLSLADQSLLLQLLTLANVRECADMIFNVLSTDTSTLGAACIDLLDLLVDAVSPELWPRLDGLERNVRMWMANAKEDALGQMIRATETLVRGNVLRDVMRDCIGEYGLVFVCADIIHSDLLQHMEGLDALHACNLIATIQANWFCHQIPSKTLTEAPIDFDKDFKHLSRLEADLADIRKSAQKEIEAEISGLEECLKAKTRQNREYESLVARLEREKREQEEHLVREYEAKLSALRSSLNEVNDKFVERERVLLNECNQLKKERDSQQSEMQNLMDKLSPLMKSFNSLRVDK